MEYINRYPKDVIIVDINCTIRSVEIYPVDSVIYLLNNWGLNFKQWRQMCVPEKIHV